MIITVLMNFHTEMCGIGWMYKLSKYMPSNAHYLIQEKNEKLLTDIQRETLYLTVLSQELENQINIFGTEEKFAEVSTLETIPALEGFFMDAFSSIEEDVTVVLALFKNRSLETACEKCGLKLKYFEYSALRQDLYYQHDLCWFLDNQVTDSKEEGTRRFLDFQKQSKDIKLKEPLTALELLWLGIEEEYALSIMQASQKGNEEYDLGIALPLDYKEFCGDWPSDRLIKEVEEKYKERKRLYRARPEQLKVYPELEQDISSKSIFFMGKCKTIISSGSNMAFEAMLLGKQAIDFSKQVFADKIVNELDIDKKCTYDDWYLNYMFFGMYVPMELLCDEEYLRWRCYETPSEAEIFNYNFDYIIRNYLGIEPEEFLKAGNRMDIIWNARKGFGKDVRAFLFDKLYDLSKIDWTQRIIICGCGKDASLVKAIVENFGGQVLEFLITEPVKRMDSFSGKPVVLWGETEYTEEDVFIITQQKRVVQRDVLMFLQEKGIKNIVII